jgi:hypothetical protein
MSRYGIVDLVKQNKSIKPVVKATDFKVEFGIDLNVAKVENASDPRRQG